MQKLGIMAALQEEIVGLLDAMGSAVKSSTIGMRTYYEGELYGIPCVVVLSRVGKVAASATAVTLIREFNITQLIFTGVAGALNAKLNIGDIVIARHLSTHDMDASPLFPKYTIPFLDKSAFSTDPTMTNALIESGQNFVQQQWSTVIKSETQENLQLNHPCIHEGLVLSGDQFINDAQHNNAILQAFPDGLCVEMEGSAVAQICYEYDMPFALFRIISDKADGSAQIDFLYFIKNVAYFYAQHILQHYIEHLKNA